MTRTTVHLLRHGEVHNPEGVLYGRLPGYRLSERGERMAAMVAKHLVDAKADLVHLVSSPLERAQQTAEPIAQATGLTPSIDERVIEADNQFQGLTFGVGDGSLRHPQHWWRLRNPLKPSWGEPYRDIERRMIAAIHDARATASGHEALIVSHQLPIWVTRLSAERRPFVHDPRTRQCSLASLTSFHFDGAALDAVTYCEPAAELLPQVHQVSGA